MMGDEVHITPRGAHFDEVNCKQVPGWEGKKMGKTDAERMEAGEEVENSSSEVTDGGSPLVADEKVRQTRTEVNKVENPPVLGCVVGGEGGRQVRGTRRNGTGIGGVGREETRVVQDARAEERDKDGGVHIRAEGKEENPPKGKVNITGEGEERLVSTDAGLVRGREERGKWLEWGGRNGSKAGKGAESCVENGAVGFGRRRSGRGRWGRGKGTTTF